MDYAQAQMQRHIQVSAVWMWMWMWMCGWCSPISTLSISRSLHLSISLSFYLSSRTSP